jgi:hypothetical protein
MKRKLLHLVLFTVVASGVGICLRPLLSSSRISTVLEVHERTGEAAFPRREEPAIAGTTSGKGQRFNWSEIESTDYQKYIANLRAIGCPEQTTRDIIAAEVHALYESKRQALLTAKRDVFWQSSIQAEAGLREDRIRIDAEERQLLRQLLPGLEAECQAESQSAKIGEMLNLGPDLEPRRPEIESWQRRWNDARNQLLVQTAGGALNDGEQAALEQLKRDYELELERLLTPAEREEFDLRNHASATTVRNALIGFEVTEAEFRTLFHERSRFDEVVSRSGVTAGEIQHARKSYEQAIDRTLGSDRAGLFQQAEDPDYQELFARAQEEGWSAAELEAKWTESQAVTAQVEDGQPAS